MATEDAGQSTDVQTAIFKKLYPVDFLRKHLDNHIREDGRALDDFRAVSIATGILQHANGSALVRFGAGTMVTAAVQAHIAEPHHDRPNEGFVTPSLDLSPLCSPQYRPGPPSDEAQALVHTLQQFLDTSLFIDRKSLCIEEGVAVWALQLDVVCVSADGNVLDSAAVAAVAALADCTLPEVLQCHDARSCIVSQKRAQKLALSGTPILSSFGIYDGAYLLADPAAFEESLLSTTVHIGLGEAPTENPDADIFFLRLAGNAMASKAGGGLSNAAIMEHCVKMARKRAKILRSLLEESLKKQD